MYEKFIAEANLNPDNFSDAWAFGNTPQMADELLELVLEGKKRATASALSLYGPDDFLPAVDGRYEILLDGKGNPRAAIQTSKVYITKFNKVQRIMPLTKVKETGAWPIGGKFMKLFSEI